MIQFSQVFKKYSFFNSQTKKREFVEIGPLDLEIKQGEFVVMVGPSGCGKTTSLRMIAGLEDITSGEIKIDEKRVNELAPGHRGVSMVFQDYGLYPHLTARQNLSFALELKKVPRESIEKKIQEVAALLKLGHLIDKKPAMLSGGERQRVAIGRCLMKDTPIWLWDEPLGALDAQLRNQMRIEIKRLHANSAIHRTSVYVTHDQHEAMSLAEKLVVMNRGKIEQIGSPIDIYNHPKNVFVAKFLGNPLINIFKNVRIESRQSELYAIGENNSFSILLPKEKCANLRHDQLVTLGVRPTDITIVSAATPTSIQAKLEFIENLGRNAYLNFQCGQYAGIADVEKADIQANTQIILNINVSNLHIFDTQTENTLL